MTASTPTRRLCKSQVSVLSAWVCFKNDAVALRESIRRLEAAQAAAAASASAVIYLRRRWSPSAAGSLPTTTSRLYRLRKEVAQALCRRRLVALLSLRHQRAICLPFDAPSLRRRFHAVSCPFQWYFRSDSVSTASYL